MIHRICTRSHSYAGSDTKCILNPFQRSFRNHKNLARSINVLHRVPRRFSPRSRYEHYCRSCWCHCVVKTKKRCPLWETIHERLFVFAEKLHRRKTRCKFFINAAREKKLIFANWKSEWRRQSPDAIIFGGKWSTSSFYVNKFSRHRVKLTRKVASRKLRPADVIALFPCLFKRNSKQKYFPRKLSTRSGIGARVSNHNFSSPNQSPKNQRKSSVGRCGSDKNALDQLAGAKFIPFWSNLHVINSFFTSSHGRCKQLTSCFPSQPSSQPR